MRKKLTKLSKKLTIGLDAVWLKKFFPASAFVSSARTSLSVCHFQLSLSAPISRATFI